MVLNTYTRAGLTNAGRLQIELVAGVDLSSPAVVVQWIRLDAPDTVIVSTDIALTPTQDTDVGAFITGYTETEIITGTEDGGTTKDTAVIRPAGANKAITMDNVGAGNVMFKGINGTTNHYEMKTMTSAGPRIQFTSHADTVDLNVDTSVEVRKEGAPILTSATVLDFGDGITVADVGGIATVNTLAGVFGAEFQWAASEVESTTTVNLPIIANKIVLTTAPLTGGTYKIDWSYGWSISNNSHQFVGRVSYGGNGDLNRDTDGATEIHFTAQKASISGPDELHTVGGFWAGVFPAGAVTIRLQFARFKTGGGLPATAFIRHARLSIQRVL